jgi:hypothetical protein
MPKRAFADLSLGWDKLCRSIEQIEESLPPPVLTQKAELASTLRETRRLQNLHVQQRSRAMETYRKLQEAIAQGSELESRLRRGLQGHYGDKSAALIRHGIRPRRPWRRKKADAGETPSD